jgi:hypothetical protein
VPQFAAAAAADLIRSKPATRAAVALPSIMQLRMGFTPLAHPAMKTPARVES